MRTSILVGLLALTTAAPAMGAGPGDPLILAPESRLWVEGTSTVRSFSCEAAGLDLKVDSEAGAASAVLAGQKAVKTAALRVPADRLDCGNATMNDHMWKALKADKNPEIRFRLATYELAPGAAGSEVVMKGTLSLGGVEKPVTIRAKASPGAAGTLHVVGSQVLKLSDHGLKAPSLMMGTMKVGDEVTVKFDLFLKS